MLVVIGVAGRVILPLFVIASKTMSAALLAVFRAASMYEQDTWRHHERSYYLVHLV